MLPWDTLFWAYCCYGLYINAQIQYNTIGYSRYASIGTIFSSKQRILSIRRLIALSCRVLENKTRSNNYCHLMRCYSLWLSRVGQVSQHVNIHHYYSKLDSSHKSLQFCYAFNV